MKKLMLMVPAILIGTSLACAPKKNGNHPMAPKEGDLQKISAKAGFDYKAGPDNALLEESFKKGDIKLTPSEDKKSVTVTVTLFFDARLGALPEGHDGTVMITGVNDGKSAAEAKATAMGDVITGKVICEDACNKVVAWVKVQDQTKDGLVTRVAGFGFDTVANKVIWKTPAKEEEKK